MVDSILLQKWVLRQIRCALNLLCRLSQKNFFFHFYLFTHYKWYYCFNQCFKAKINTYEYIAFLSSVYNQIKKNNELQYCVP